MELASETGHVVVATTLDSAGDLENIKLRNLDYSSWNTQGRGGVDDLTALTHLHEPAILDVLVSLATPLINGPVLIFSSVAAVLAVFQRRHLHECWSNSIGAQPLRRVCGPLLTARARAVLHAGEVTVRNTL